MLNIDLAELRKIKASHLERMRAIVESADEADREITAEEQAEFDGLKAKCEEAEKEIAARRARMNNDAALAALGDEPHDVEDDVEEAVASPGGSRAVTRGLRERQQDDPCRGFANLGDFALAARSREFGQVDERLNIWSAAGDGMQQLIREDGGMLVPPAFSRAIWDRLNEASESLLARTDQLPPLPAGTDSMEFPAVNETSRADGSRHGGIQGYWKSELSELTSSKATLRSVKFEPSELYVFAYISDKLLKNAAMLESWLANKAADEINFKVGNAIINGTGSGQPRGILTGAADKPRVRVAKESNQKADTVVAQNIDKMYARLHPAVRSSAVWFVDLEEKLPDLNKAVGTGGNLVFMPPGGMAGSPLATLKGLPVIPLEYCGAIGDEGDIILAALSMYGTMARGTIDSAMSMHLKFDFAQTAFRFIFEIDGQPWVSDSLTPFTPSGGTAKGYKTSPFVTLAERA